MNAAVTCASCGAPLKRGEYAINGLTVPITYLHRSYYKCARQRLENAKAKEEQRGQD